MAQADRSHFEQEWENAFENARRKPSPKVWEGIENSLNGGHSNQKRMFLLQLAMAASVLFAMSIGAAGVYQEFFADKKTASPAGISADNESSIQQNNQDDSGGNASEAIESNNYADNQIALNDKVDTGDKLSGSNQESEQPVNTASVADKIKEKATEQPMPRLVEGSVSSSFKSEIDRLDPFSASLVYTSDLPSARPRGVPNVITLVDKKRSQAGWASLGVSAGSYNAGSSQNSYRLASSSLDNSVSVGRISEESTGSVFQVEMNVGKQFAAKWFVQGGLGYMERNSEGASNMISASGFSVADNAYAERNEVVVAEPYNLENSMQMITLPVQIGYILLDQRIGVRILTGIANELMLKYQIQDSEGDLSSQTIRSGDSDDYNAYGMSALVTTELSYALADRYQVAVYPQMRKSLMPLRETDSDLPLSMEIGFRFRYMIE